MVKSHVYCGAEPGLINLRISPAVLHCRVVSNICTMACSDPAETPSAAQQDPPLDAVPTDVAAKMDSAADEDPARVAAAIARRVSMLTQGDERQEEVKTSCNLKFVALLSGAGCPSG